jgi:CheY-like chemotaxis protein
VCRLPSQQSFQSNERMSDNLLSLRLVVVSRSAEDHELFRQAAASAAMPIEIVTVDGAAAARGVLAGADLLYLDDGLSRDEIKTIVAAACAARNPPFTVQLSERRRAAEPFATDAIADKPWRPEEARRLVNCSMRVRLPSWVLVVDDSATMRGIVRRILANVRFPLEVCEASEGFAAIKMVRDHAIDLVFIDYNMPGFNGLETISEFKREKRRVHVVLMTSVDDPSLELRAGEAGAAFLRKPFYPADIEAALCRFYGLRALNPKRV